MVECRVAAGYESDVSTVLLQVSCAFCGKPLRDPISVERGWGPDCDDNYMGGAGEGDVIAQMQSLFDPREAAEAIRQAPNVRPTTWVEPLQTAKKGQLLEDGTKAKGGEILTSRPLAVSGFHDYLVARGGSPDDPRAPWQLDLEVRRKLVSNAMWYASRAVTFGFEQSEVSAEKVDPRFMVVASAQRLARAFGLTGAADRMANFYGARIVRVVKARLKQFAAGEREAIIFETHVPAGHYTFPGARRGVGPGMVRVHTPYSDQFNRLARENKALFVAFEKDPPYFWRYFHEGRLRDVINILQSCFGDRASLTRPMQAPAERVRRRHMRRIVDSWTGEVRLFDHLVAGRLLTSDRYKEV